MLLAEVDLESLPMLELNLNKPLIIRNPNNLSLTRRDSLRRKENKTFSNFVISIFILFRIVKGDQDDF